MHVKWTTALTLTLYTLAMPLPAAAYIGPGAGLSAIGTLVALVGALFMLLAGFVWYPVKRVLRRRGAARDAEAARQSAAGAESRE